MRTSALYIGTYGGQLVQPKQWSRESKWSPRYDETGDDLTMPCPSSDSFFQVKGYFLQWQTKEVWRERGRKKIHCMLDKPKQQLMGNVEKVLHHLLPTLYTVKKWLISKAWSGCLGRVMRRNQAKNQEQIKWSRCNQSAAGVRSCRSRGEHLGWQWTL